MTSLFGEFLSELIQGVSGAVGAILQDWDGETVDYAGELDADELCIHAAQWGLMWRMVKYQFNHPQLKMLREIVIQASTQKIIITSIFNDYYIVFILKKDSNLKEAQNRLASKIQVIKKEMGL